MSSLPSTPPTHHSVNPNWREIQLRQYREAVGRNQHLLDLAELEWRQLNNNNDGAEVTPLLRNEYHNKVNNLRQRLGEAKWALGRVMLHKAMG